MELRKEGSRMAQQDKRKRQSEEDDPITGKRKYRNTGNPPP
jgi:hypothetical protein